MSRHRHTDTDKASQYRNKAAQDLVSLAERTLRTPQPIERARAAANVPNLAEAMVAASIRHATDSGASWRELDARLAVPFPTLYRRYGGR